MPGVIVPRKTVLELTKPGRGSRRRGRDRPVERQDPVPIDGLVLTSKLIDGTFPIMSASFPATMTRSSESTPRVRRGGGPRLDHFERKGPRREAQHRERPLILSVNNPIRGLPRRRSSPTTGRSARYRLQLALPPRHCRPGQGRTAEFRFADAGSPTIIRDPEDDRALYVLMPMRV